MKIFILEKDPIRIEFFKRKLSGHEIFFRETYLKAVKALSSQEIFDQIYLDQGSGGIEVAQWIREHDEKRPYRIVVHGFTVHGAQEILNLLPEASFIPGVWLLNRMEF